MQQIIKTSFDFACSIAKERGIKMLYATVSPMMQNLLIECGIRIEILDNAFPLYQDVEAEKKYPIAYKDYQDYSLFWKSNPQLCLFVDY